jgi:hypothetical protein
MSLRRDALEDSIPQKGSLANMQAIASLPAIRLGRKIGTLPTETMSEIKKTIAWAPKCDPTDDWNLAGRGCSSGMNESNGLRRRRNRFRLQGEGAAFRCLKTGGLAPTSLGAGGLVAVALRRSHDERHPDRQEFDCGRP